MDFARAIWTFIYFSVIFKFDSHILECCWIEYFKYLNIEVLCLRHHRESQHNRYIENAFL